MNIQVDWGVLLGFQGRSVGYVIRVSGYNRWISVPGRQVSLAVQDLADPRLRLMALF